MIADYLTERKITLDDASYPKLRLGEFFRLQKLRKDFYSSIRKGNKNLFKNTLLEIWQLQTRNIVPENKRLYNLIIDVISIINQNDFDNPPVALVPPPKPSQKKSDEEKKKERWEYEGQFVSQWIDSFARNYGWSLSEIFNLDIDVAAYLLQEIYLNEQFDKEWQYNLSEMAYEYDSHTKTSKHRPLKRPYWMNDAMDVQIKKTKLIRSMLPMGEVIDLSGIGAISQNVEKPIPSETQRSDSDTES